MIITDSEYLHLIELEKSFKEQKVLQVGPPPIQWSRDIIATNKSEFFLLDGYRGSFEVKKYTFNKRYRQVIILIRLDSLGRHTNPDGTIFDGPHIHLYKEGFGDKFAFPVNKIGLKKPFKIEDGLIKLLKYCNVINIPSIQSSVY